MNLQGKCVLISGGSRPIGRAIARKFYEKGAIVYLISRHADKVALIAQEIDPSGNRVIPMPCDISSVTSIDEAFDRIDASNLVVDVLINATDIAIEKSLENLQIEEWTRTLKTNLTGALILSKKCFAGMKNNGGGKIINIASLLSDEIKPNLAAYSAAKGGLTMLTRSIALEWGKYNIQSNIIINSRFEMPESNALSANEVVDVEKIRSRRSLSEDIADVAIYLTSDKAEGVSGKEITLDEEFLTAILKK